MSQQQTNTKPAGFAGEIRTANITVKVTSNVFQSFIDLLISGLQTSNASLVFEDLPSKMTRFERIELADGSLEFSVFPSDELLTYAAGLISELDLRKSANTAVSTPSPLAPARFTILNGSDTVRDERTNLIWARSVSPEAMNWKAATEYVANLRTGGHSDWRLPTRAELLTLVDDTRCDPAIDTDAFPNTPSRYHWSSSPYAGYSDYAWGVYFGGGDSNAYCRSDVGFVRAVRGPVAASQ